VGASVTVRVEIDADTQEEHDSIKADIEAAEFTVTLEDVQAKRIEAERVIQV